MGEELVPQSLALTRTRHQTGNVHKLNCRWDGFLSFAQVAQDAEAGVRNGNDADVGLDGAEGEVGSLCGRVLHQRVEKRRLYINRMHIRKRVLRQSEEEKAIIAGLKQHPKWCSLSNMSGFCNLSSSKPTHLADVRQTDDASLERHADVGRPVHEGVFETDPSHRQWFRTRGGNHECSRFCASVLNTPLCVARALLACTARTAARRVRVCCVW